MSDIQSLQARLLEYEKRMGIGENDPTKDGYLVLVKLLRQQNEYLKTVDIKTLITDEAKGKTSEFERSKALWEKLPNMIESVTTLKAALKIEGEDKKLIQKPITSKSIANGEEDVFNN